MAANRCETSYARLSVRQARTVLTALILIACFCVAVTLSPAARGNVGKRRPGQGDAALYLAEVERIHAGEGYYQAAAAELHERGYPTRSVFNWRTPLPMWLIGHLPTVILGKVFLGALALGLVLAAFAAISGDTEGSGFGIEGSGFRVQGSGLETQPLAASQLPPTTDCPCPETHGSRSPRHRPPPTNFRRALMCVLLLSGALMPCVLDNFFVMPVLWSGVLIAISICAYGVNRPGPAVVFGLASVFFRELALPYCLLAAAMAAWHRRRRELLAWVVGLAAWLAFFALHWLHVTALIPPDAHAHREGWIQFGGAGFVLSVVQVNAFLLLLPQWVTALYFVAAMFGLAGWHSPLGVRTGLTVCLFLMAFAFVGQPFNQYWGALVSPLLCFGVVRLPVSLRELLAAAR